MISGTFTVQTKTGYRLAYHLPMLMNMYRYFCAQNKNKNQHVKGVTMPLYHSLDVPLSVL